MPCIRGLRIPVATVVGMVADSMTDEEILKAFPDLEREDIRLILKEGHAIMNNRIEWLIDNGGENGGDR